MKKVLLIIMCLFLLCGCGNKEEEKKTISINMSKVSEKLSNVTIDGKNPFSNKENINDLDLIKGYSVDVDLFDEYVIYLSSSVEDPSMYMVLKPKKDKESVVKYQINDMYKEYLAAYQGYYPEAVPTIENRLEKEEGDYLIYVVSKDNNSVYNKIMECKD